MIDVIKIVFIHLKILMCNYLLFSIRQPFWLAN